MSHVVSSEPQKTDISSVKLLLIIPCYNEEGSVSSLLREIGKLGIACDPLVIDDGSRDSTSAEAKPLSRCVTLLQNLGIGGAVQTGIRYAYQNGYDLCMQVDGDGQHPPDQIPVILRAWQEKPANMVIGSRYLGKGGFRSTLARRTGSSILSLVMGLLFDGIRFTDPTSGMRLMDSKAMRLFYNHYPFDYPEPISIVWALRCGLTIREVAVAMRAREQGVSSIRGLKPLLYMIRVVFYIVMGRFLPRSALLLPSKRVE